MSTTKSDLTTVLIPLKRRDIGYASVRPFLYFDPPTLLRPKRYVDFFGQTLVRPQLYFDLYFSTNKKSKVWQKVEVERSK